MRTVFLLLVSVQMAGQVPANPDLPVVAHRRVPETYCELVVRGTLHLAESGVILQMEGPKEGLHASAFSNPLGFLEYDPYELDSDDRENVYYAAKNAGYVLRTGQPASTRELPSLQLAQDMPGASCGSLESARQVLAAQPVPERTPNSNDKQITPPQKIKGVDPQYSERARRNRIEGIVVVTLILKEDGTPTYMFVSRSLDSDLDRNAIDAVRRWQFTPAMRDGHAISSWINVQVNFHLYFR
jgi:TonB family protein